jgi:hypothetical protein
MPQAGAVTSGSVPLESQEASVAAAVRRGRLSDRIANAPVLAVAAPFVVAYLVAALLLPLPVIYQDEGFYQRLARSLAHGDGLALNGEAVSLRSTLFVYLITPIWWLASGVRAWEIAKVEAVLLTSLVAVPVWLFAREVLQRGLALLAVALVLAGTWMAASASIMTEAVGLPLATAALVAMVQAIRKQSSRAAWVALALVLIAAWTRIQLIVLVPVMWSALVLDVVRGGRGWRARLASHRAVLAALSAVLLLGLAVVAVGGRDVVGSYRGIAAYRPPMSDVLAMSGWELAHLAVACGLLPVPLLIALAARRAAWRDPVVGPLLAVLVPALLVLAVQNGFFISGRPGLWPIQRYMIYVAPLLLVFVLVALSRRGLVGWWTLAATAVISAGYAGLPQVMEASEQRAVYTTVARVRDVAPGASTAAAVLVVAMLVCAVAALATWAARRRSGTAAAFVGLMLLATLLVQTASSMSWQLGVERVARRYSADDLAWVDHHSHGPVSVLRVTGPPAGSELVPIYNAAPQRVYAYGGPPPNVIRQDRVCGWTITDLGDALFDRGCAPPSDQFLIGDPVTHIHFYGETASVTDPAIGRLVTVRPPLHVQSLVTMPCTRDLPALEPVTMRQLRGQPLNCAPGLAARTFLRRPGVLEIVVRGAPRARHTAAIDGQAYAIPPGRTTILSGRVPSGRSDLQVQFDWSRRGAAFPLVTDVVLRQGSQRTSLL